MKTTRRQFAKGVGAVAALAVTSVPAEAKNADAEAELVKAEFGQHLNADEMAKIRKDFAESAPQFEKLRAVKLTNGDEPDWTFSALAKR